jgi:hypothetical protein
MSLDGTLPLKPAIAAVGRNPLLTQRSQRGAEHAEKMPLALKKMAGIR